MITAGLVAFLLLADAEAAPPTVAPPAPAPSSEAAPESPPPATTNEPAPAPIAPPLPEVEPPPQLRPRRYGDQGMPEIGLGLGYSQAIGVVGAGAFRYFVIDGVAPGFEAT